MPFNFSRYSSISSSIYLFNNSSVNSATLYYRFYFGVNFINKSFIPLLPTPPPFNPPKPFMGFFPFGLDLFNLSYLSYLFNSFYFFYY